VSLVGAVVWGVVPFVPQAPFRIYAGQEREPITVANVKPLVESSLKGDDNQFDFLVPGKARPVLILTDKHADDLQEYLALRLARLAKFTEAEQQTIRTQQHPTLFHLKPEKFSLPEENAAMLDSLVRVHANAIDPKPTGTLDEYELRTIQERLVLFHGFDLRGLLKVALGQMEAKSKTGERK
jgi:hypothetical protein